MFSIKDSITRLSKAVRQLESITSSSNESTRIGKSTQSHAGVSKSALEEISRQPRKRVTYRTDRNIPLSELKAFKPLVRRYSREIFNDFLKPLDMPHLKSLQLDKPRYPVERARSNWSKKHNRLLSFQVFLQERARFKEMMDLLVHLTPEELKSPENRNNHEVSLRLLEKLKDDAISNRIEGVPSFHYHEIPPLPTPLTADSFERYIYYLSHSKILYKNSSSLQSGIVPHILLYTHKLTNTEFKPFRSANTYNYLIKYFGYDKHQSRFARELSLAMKIEGHSPNIDTINNLLRLCKKQAHIRSLESNYSRIIKYLRIAKLLKLQANLTTWNRIYDCIGNLMLKEVFIERISRSNIPITKNLSLRILDDFIKEVAQDVTDVVEFVENDLKMRDGWRLDPVVLNKIISYAIQKCNSPEELAQVWEQLIVAPGVALNAQSLSAILFSIKNNSNLTSKITLMLQVYVKLTHSGKLGELKNSPHIFKHIISQISRSTRQYDYEKLGKVVRCLIHQEATEALQLPIEVTKIVHERSHSNEDIVEDGQQQSYDVKLWSGLTMANNPVGISEKDNDIINHSHQPFNFAYSVSRCERAIPENYRIMKRLVGFQLDTFEGNYLYYNWLKSQTESEMASQPIRFLCDPPSSHELEQWSQLKSKLLNSAGGTNKLHPLPDPRILDLVGETRSAPYAVPKEVGSQYQRIQISNASHARTRDRLYQLDQGFTEYYEDEMRDRSIIA